MMKHKEHYKFYLCKVVHKFEEIGTFKIFYKNLKVKRLLIDNFLINFIEKFKIRKFQKVKPSIFPINCRFNISGICNLRCQFCEIHYFYSHAKSHSGKIYPNFLSVSHLVAMNDLLSSVSHFGFETGVGEPLLNPNFCEIIKFFKINHPKISLSVTTNAIAMKSNIIREIITNNNFEAISCSVHAGNCEIYKKLLGEDFLELINNIHSLIKCRDDNKLKKTQISLNFCLNTVNAASLKELIDIGEKIGVDYLTLYHYYQSRNQLINDISFFFHPSEGNRFLIEGYSYAQTKKVKICPNNPTLIDNEDSVEVCNKIAPCYAPWTNIQFPPCIEYENMHLVGVCNRINLLRIDMEKWGKTDQFIDIWHHPVLQYLRLTVNNQDRNPICNFCQSGKTAKIRCKNPEEYSKVRDRAIREFFIDINNNYDEIPIIDGIEILNSNPYEYDPDFFAYHTYTP